MRVATENKKPIDDRLDDGETNPGNGAPTVGPFSVISRDICIEGELEGAENLVIEGRVKGRIKSQGDVTITASGNVEAEIAARNITIQGRVNGNVEAMEAVEIQQQGILIGDCRARSFQIREGARFEGRSDILT